MLNVDENDIDRITEALHGILQGRMPPPIALAAGYPDNEIRQLTQYVNRFIAEYGGLAGAMDTLSRGDLEAAVPRCGMRLGQSMKHLQANLRHLTWKAQQIAKGDFSQQVDFMGEFSAAFNSMTQQLKSAFETIEEQNRVLEEKVRERTKELRDSRLEIVRRLARAAEFRDTDTGLHVTRMSLYSAELGRGMGMDEVECELLLNASALHDIGKIGIPDRILLKPGRFEPEESKIIRGHVAIGGSILSKSASQLLQLAESIALTHHEKWDGSGYPRGLKGEEILLAGRIVAICDVFDALTSPRPYKRAWTVAEALAEIEQGSGTHFDPRLVEVFKQVLPKIVEIRAHYAEQALPLAAAEVVSSLDDVDKPN